MSTVYPEYSSVEAEKLRKVSLSKLIKGIRRAHKDSLIHYQITPSNIFIDHSNDRKFLLAPCDLTLSPFERIKQTKAEFLAKYSLKLPELNDVSACFDIQCLAYTLAAIFPDEPIDTQFGIQKVSNFDVEPAYISTLLENLLTSASLDGITL